MAAAAAAAARAVVVAAVAATAVAAAGTKTKRLVVGWRGGGVAKANRPPHHPNSFCGVATELVFTTPPPQPVCYPTDSGLPLSFAFKPNRNGAARFAHSLAGG